MLIAFLFTRRHEIASNKIWKGSQFPLFLSLSLTSYLWEVREFYFVLIMVGLWFSRPTNPTSANTLPKIRKRCKRKVHGILSQLLFHLMLLLSRIMMAFPRLLPGHQMSLSLSIGISLVSGFFFLIFQKLMARKKI